MRTSGARIIMRRKSSSQEPRNKIGTFTTKRRIEVDEMASKSKRLHEDVLPYAEESFSDDEDDQMEYEEHKVQQQLLRTPARSEVSGGSDSLGNGTSEVEEINPAQAAAIAANLPGAGAVRRRGRGPSKRPCLNRNAQMARENRQRKKVYLQSIEDKLNEYHAKNKALVGIIEKQNKQIQSLASNVSYFQALVANQSEITTLLVALNEAIKALHGGKDTVTGSLPNKITAALQNVNSSVNKLPPRHQKSVASNVDEPAPLPGTQNSNFGQIARKTMPLTKAASEVTSSLSPAPKTDEPSSVESLFVDDSDTRKFEQSPESHSYCKYNVMDTSSVGPGSWSINRVPTTPLSEAQSNSLDQGEASLSETDLDALSNINVDSFLFNNVESLPNSPMEMQLHEQCNNDLDEFFDNVNAKIPKLSTDEVDDLLGIDETSRFNRTLFNTLNPPTGICLHVNSSRVSLEYCHICYKRSLAKIDES